MALRNRSFFFDPLNNDRFNSQDIPTEATMRDWCDSVPFIKETADRSQLGRAGIAKTTTDANINAGSNNDQAGNSPAGFTTFIRPAQLPVMIDSPSVTWTKVPRGGATNTDTGVGIEDWQATVALPTVPENTDDIVLVDNYTLNSPASTDVCNDTQTVTNVSIGDPSTALLDNIVSAMNAMNAKISELSNATCTLAGAGVDLGDVMLSYSPPATWSSYWLEPKGQLLSVSAYPELYVIFGNTYGGVAGVNFNLPDLTSNQNYLRAFSGAGLIAPANIHGGLQDYTLVINDIPSHNHSISSINTSSEGDHYHQITIAPAAACNSGFDYALGANIIGDTAVDACQGATDGERTVDSGITKPKYSNLTTGNNTTGNHYHTLSGNTNNTGGNPNDPVWDMSAFDKTPAYTNFYLKMRVK